MDLGSDNPFNTLRVTPLHDDEGYLSPSDDDLKNSYVRRPGGFLNCRRDNPPYFHPEEPEVGEEDCIEWEKIALIPYIREEHFSWDRLQLPVPYRFQEEHKSCLRQIRKPPSASYLTDSSGEKLSEVVENIWKSFDPDTQRDTRLSKAEKSCGNQSDPKAAVLDIQSGKASPIYVSVEQFIQHVFHLLCGRESISFSIVPGGKRFMKNPLTLVRGFSPSLVLNLSIPFLKCGQIFKRLNYISSLHYDETLVQREGLKSNAVCTALLKFIADYLKLYQTCLMLKAKKVRSISKLNLFSKPFQHQLEALELILDLYITSDQITLLKGLNTLMLCCETPFVADLLRSAFIACSAAYLRYVSDWIFRGVLAEGFHIQRAKLCTYQDRRYWIKQFSQVTGSVPTFMEDVVNLIFETGKAINLLNLVRDNESMSAPVFYIFQDEDSVMLPTVEFEDVAALQTVWKMKVSSFFGEYSFLQTDVDAALARPNDTGSSKRDLDFEAIEGAKVAFETKQAISRQQLLDQKIEKQRILMKSLNEQVEAKRSREKQKKEDEVLENKRISAYIAEVDQRDLQEEIRLMNKHFGTRISETVGVRNVKSRIAITEQYVRVADVSTGALNNSHPQSNNTEPYNASVDDNIGSTNIYENGSDLPDYSCEVHSTKPSLTDGVNESSTTNDVAENSKGEVLSTSSNGRRNCYEEKFNPDKLKVRDPEPYNTCLDFDTSGSMLTPQPLMKFSSCDTTVHSEDVLKRKNQTRQDSFLLNLFLSQSTAIPVGAQNRMVNATLLHYFIVEKRLTQHLEALNSYLCLQNGLFGHFLTTLLMQEVKTKSLLNKEDIPRKFGRLNEILGEAMALSNEGREKNDFRDNFAFIMVREGYRNSMDLDNQKPIKSKILTSRYEVLNDITLNYSVEWPLSILITDDLLITYERIFTFLMQLYRAELLLLDIPSVIKFRGSRSKQLAIIHHYRYRMLHFVRTVRHYINVTVIHCAWVDLGSSIHKMNSLDKIYEGLVRHIKFVSTNCLQGTKGEAVKKLLVDQLTVIECFCTDVEQYSNGIDWDNGEEIPLRRFAKLDQKFKVWEEIQKVFIQVKMAESISSSIPLIVAQLKSALMPDIQKLVVDQVCSLTTPPIVDSLGGEPPGVATTSPTNPSGLPDEDNGEDFDIDPLATINNTSWDPPLPTKEACEKYLRKQLNKEERLKIVEKFPVPNLVVSRTPSLDKSILQIMNQRKMSIRQIPGALALEAVQSRLLDITGPLAAIHAAASEALGLGGVLSPQSVLEAINHALVLLGNASSQATYQRQRSILSKLNPSALPFLSKDGLAAEEKDLFGPQVRKSLKEANEVKREFGIGFDRPRSFAPFRRQPQIRSSYDYRATRPRPYDPKYKNSAKGNFPPSRFPPPKGESLLPLFGGRIRHFSNYWKSITDDPWIHQCVSGYRLPFATTAPKPFLNPAPHIIGEKSDIITAEIQELLTKGVIEATNTQYFLNQIFIIPKKDGKSWRPILNLKPLNKHLRKEHFKMESVTVIRDLLKPGMWMAKLDLKDAYFALPICTTSRKFLQFVWCGVTYQYTAVPFGLSSAPYAFCKVTKPLIGLLRQEGLTLIIYLDDILIIDNDVESTMQAVGRVKSVFEQAGFVINETRSVQQPVQYIEFLGFIIDSRQFLISLPASKQERLLKCATDLLQEEVITPRKLAHFIGQVTASKFAYRTCNLKIRECQLLLISELRLNQNWDKQFIISEAAKLELKWWTENSRQLAPSPIALEEVTLEIASDASMDGWGAWCKLGSSGGRWTVDDLARYPHINQLELYAALLALQCFLTKETTAVKLKLDNRTAVAYINKLGGTRSTRLNQLALHLWDWCINKGVWITADYLPGVDNTQADWESRRHLDSSGWSLNGEVFSQLMTRFPCDVDLFADRTNHKLQAYCSWRPDPCAMTVDGFSLNWNHMRGYAFPPFCLVGRCLRKCVEDQAEILLVAPIWKYQTWYPLLLRSIAALPLLLPQSENLLLDVLNRPHPLVKTSRLPLAAWLVSGKADRVAEFQKQLVNSYPTQSDSKRSDHTSLHGTHFAAGVLKGMKIPFELL